jgi:hypothetical protein
MNSALVPNVVLLLAVELKVRFALPQCCRRDSLRRVEEVPPANRAKEDSGT